MPYFVIVIECLWAMSLQNKNLLGAIADLRAAAAAMKQANAAKASPTNKTSKNRRKRAARRAAKAASGSTNNSSLGALQGAPVAIGYKRGNARPTFGQIGNDGSIVIRFREYVGEVAGTTGWTTTTYVIQPGLQTLFVWLSAIAGNYDKYKFRRLRFCYETESPTSQAGSVVLVIDPDVLDAAPMSKQEALSFEMKQRTAPWQPCCLDFDIARAAQRDLMYVRGGSVPTGADQRLYDLGNLYVGTQNCSGSTGELWVEYEVELHAPQANVTPVSSKWTGSTSLTAAALVGADAAYAVNSNAGWALTNASTLTCTVAGDYLFTLNIVGTTLVNTSTAWGGTATSTPLSRIANSGQTTAVYNCAVRAQVGQTLIPAIDSAATVSAVTGRIARYQYGLA